MKLHRIKWRLARYINFNSPVHLDVELSTKCKLNCDFCFRQDNKYPAQEMTASLFFEILLQASEMEIKSIKFNWRGEALEAKDALYCFKITKSFGIYTMLNTSLAMDLTDNNLKIIAKTIDNLKISFDSSIPEVYNRIRKGADYFTTLKNLDRLNYWRDVFKKLKIILNRRVTKGMETDREFKQFFGSGYDYDIKPAIERNSQDIYLNALQGKQRRYCAQPSRRMVVDVDGNVWACCVAYKGQQELFLGNIQDKTLKELWQSFKRLKLVRNLKKGIYNIACLNCTSQESYK